MSVHHPGVWRPLEQVIRGGRPVRELEVQKECENYPPPVHLCESVTHTKQTPQDKQSWLRNWGQLCNYNARDPRNQSHIVLVTDPAPITKVWGSPLPVQLPWSDAQSPHPPLKNRWGKNVPLKKPLRCFFMREGLNLIKLSCVFKHGDKIMHLRGKFTASKKIWEETWLLLCVPTTNTSHLTDEQRRIML